MSAVLKNPELTVNFERLQNDIDTLATIGRREDHGIYRMAFSDADMEARAWLKGRMEEAGLDIYEDGAANVHGRYKFDYQNPSVMMGSHIDSVPGAGHLDGALGVMVALECVRRIKELDLPLKHPLEVVAFTDEEGRFGGMPGSQAMAGQLSPEDIYNAHDLDGMSLTDAMKARGLNAMDMLRARRNPDSIHAFLELHIEQGPVLDRTGIPIGIVEGIAGVRKWDVRLIGAANHAGTTPMDMRRDAFLGVAELAGELPRILEEEGSANSVATIGRVELKPGAANVVPGQADFILEVRDTDAEILNNLANGFRRTLSAIARRRDLMFEFEVLSDIEPVKCDPGIMNAIAEVTEAMNIRTKQMPSGAAHDTQFLARLTRAGMIFVPSKDGRSHSPAEWTAWEDIETGANVALNTLYRLASG
jgi:N-carbamoyl-L-amino-acid hydrolase